MQNNSQHERITIVDIDDTNMSGADAAIKASQAEAQKRLVKIIKGGAGLVALMLIIFLLWRALENSSLRSGVSSQKTADDPGLSSTIPHTEHSKNASDLPEIRNQLIDALSDVEVSIERLSKNVEYQQWNPGQLQTFQTEKDAILSLFAKGAYSSAQQALKRLNAAIKTFEDEFVSTYKQYIADAQEAFDNDKINDARLAFSKADALSPTSANNEPLKPRLLNYDAVATIRASVNVARIENNQSTALELLQQLVSLNEATSDEKQEIERLKAFIKKENLTMALAAARKAMDQKDFETATQFLTDARAIDPSNNGVNVLTQSLDDLIRSEQQQLLVNSLRGDADSDDWDSVMKKASAGAQTFPDNTAISDYRHRASAVVSAKNALNPFIQAPQRLADAGVREYALEQFKNALSASLDSPSLASMLSTLDNDLRKYQTAVVVEVKSDAKSFVSVVGVGNVGVVASKQISLTPGVYTFEAKRAGYKTARIDAEITLTGSNTITIAATQEL